MMVYLSITQSMMTFKNNWFNTLKITNFENKILKKGSVWFILQSPGISGVMCAGRFQNRRKIHNESCYTFKTIVSLQSRFGIKEDKGFPLIPLLSERRKGWYKKVERHRQKGIFPRVVKGLRYNAPQIVTILISIFWRRIRFVC